jgi:hypothetical protein
MKIELYEYYHDDRIGLTKGQMTDSKADETDGTGRSLERALGSRSQAAHAFLDP